MSALLQRLQLYWQDTSFVPIKEWSNERGAIGVYQSQDYGYIYMAVQASEKLYFHQYQSECEHIALKDAEAVALFADAKAKEQSHTDTRAWQAYRSVERRYSEANRRLAESDQ